MADIQQNNKSHCGASNPSKDRHSPHPIVKPKPIQSQHTDTASAENVRPSNNTDTTEENTKAEKVTQKSKDPESDSEDTFDLEIPEKKERSRSVTFSETPAEIEEMRKRLQRTPTPYAADSDDEGETVGGGDESTTGEVGLKDAPEVTYDLVSDDEITHCSAKVAAATLDGGDPPAEPIPVP